MEEDIKHLKQFVNLYKQCKPVNRLKKVDNEESLIFSFKNKGDLIRFGCTKKLLDYIPQREGLYDFFRENKYFWIIPLEISPGKVYGYMVRGYSQKSYNVFRLNNIPAVIFGLYDFEKFNFHKDYVIITEGVKDALTIKTLYPYTISLNTAGLTVNSFNLLKAITNKFILIYDNDRAGKEATEKDLKLLKDNHCIAHSIKLRFKDPGEYAKHPKELEILNSNITKYITR